MSVAIAPRRTVFGLTFGFPLALVLLAVLVALLKPLLPETLIRVPLNAVMPYDRWLQGLFDFITDDLGFGTLTRHISAGLEVVLDATGNLLFGKNRWPHIGPLPWTSVAAAMAVLGLSLIHISEPTRPY